MKQAEDADLFIARNNLGEAFTDENADYRFDEEEMAEDDEDNDDASRWRDDIAHLMWVDYLNHRAARGQQRRR